MTDIDILKERKICDVCFIIDDIGDCSCSECGSMYINCTDAYCPNCGAKMAPYEPYDKGVTASDKTRTSAAKSLLDMRQ
ncbi:MAG: hypothetical protein RR635_10705 [Oscillospiraceae bacterium]